MGHHSAHDDGDEHTSENEEHAEIANVGKEAVHEKHNAAASPGTEEEADKGHPLFGLETGVHELIHGDGLLGQNQGH